MIRVRQQPHQYELLIEAGLVISPIVATSAAGKRCWRTSGVKMVEGGDEPGWIGATAATL